MADRPPLRAGVLGTGALGRHHARLLSALDDVDLMGVYDVRPEVAQRVATEWGTRAFDSADELVAAGLDAAVVAVPTVHHEEVATALLAAGAHVLVEKPLAPTLEAADRLCAAAATADRVLAVGHVEFFNPAVQAVLRAAPAPRFIEIQRLSPFTPRSLDVDVVLDLMIHDLQILHALDDSPVREIRATGIEVLSSRVDIANARVELASGCVANITASRVSAEAVRKLRLFSPRRYHSLDYRAQEVKGYRLAGGEERTIVEESIEVDGAEPLRRELEAFVAACRGAATPLVDGATGRRALATALAVGAAIGGAGGTQ